MIEAFKEVAELSRRQVAQSLVGKFNLEEKARARMEEFGVSTPWQAFIQVRLGYYQSMLTDPQVLLDNRWPHNPALLEKARQAQCKTGLATMSHCSQTQRVLEILELTNAFDFIATRDDVEHGKPDPEIYTLVGTELSIPARQCLVIEDSSAGVQAALAAGMWCISVTTPFTQKAVHARGLLEEHWIVDDPNELLPVVGKMLEERASEENS